MKPFKTYSKIVILVADTVIIASLIVRQFVFLTRGEINEIFFNITELLLAPIPGKLADVNLAAAGFDIHSVMGIGFYILFGAVAIYLVNKLFRDNVISFISGVIDVWTSLMLGAVGFGLILLIFGMQIGASPLTDIALGMVEGANRGSVISQTHLMAIFLFISIFLIGILTDYLLELRFTSDYNFSIKTEENPDLNISEIRNGVWNRLKRAVTSFSELFNLKEVLEQQKLLLQESLMTSSKGINKSISWDSWSTNYRTKKGVLTDFIEP